MTYRGTHPRYEVLAVYRSQLAPASKAKYTVQHIVSGCHDEAALKAKLAAAYPKLISFRVVSINGNRVALSSPTAV